MKRTYIFPILAVCLLQGTITYANPSDRIDVIIGNDTTSLMVEMVGTITPAPRANDQKGYTAIRVTDKWDTTVTLPIPSGAEIRYRQANRTKAHGITMAQDDHARFVLLDCYNQADLISGAGTIDPDMPIGWRGNQAGEDCHFMIFADKGHEIEGLKIEGRYSGINYTAFSDFLFESEGANNTLGVDCTGFNMPFEPLHITASSRELTTHHGQPFVGSFAGNLLRSGAKRLFTSTTNPSDLDILANGTYWFAANDEMAFEYHDLYTPEKSETTGMWTLLRPEQVEDPFNTETIMTYCAEIFFINHDFALLRAYNSKETKLDNTYWYVFGRQDHSFAYASADDHGYKTLLELKQSNGEDLYMFMSNYCNERYIATPRFVEGNSIASACRVFFTYNGAEQLLYTNSGNGSIPEFRFRGDEFGIFTGENGNITLDGFGTATIGTASYPYTITGSTVTIAKGTEDMQIVVDKPAKTYTVLTSAKTWTGPKHYRTETALGWYQRGEDTNNNTIDIRFDSDLNGNPKEGYAAVDIKVTANDGFTPSSLIANTCAYTYNADNNTIILNDLWIGDSYTSIAKKNILLTFSDDLKTMTIDSAETPYIFSFNRDGSGIYCGTDSQLQAVE